MSEDPIRELMTLVERVVRPLPIALARQKRLRADFLEHLQTIYREEFLRTADATAAVERMRLRFGDPAQLSAELRRSIRWTDSLKFRWERLWEQGPGESVLRYSARLVSRMAAGLTLTLGLLVADHHFFGTVPFSIAEVMAPLSAILFLSSWMGCFLLFGFTVGREWEQPRRRWSQIAFYSTLLIASWPASLSLMMFVAGGTWSEYAFPLVASLFGGIFSVICGTAVGVLHHREMLYRREWSQLILDPA